MSFSVRLTADLVTVEAGATVPVSIEVASKGSEPDRFEIQVEGIDHLDAVDEGRQPTVVLPSDHKP